MGKVIEFKRKVITNLKCSKCNGECEREDNQYLHWHCKECGNSYMINQETGNILDISKIFGI
ncbi:hypothetical protein N494_18765 (plasmid) [Clostridium botulinum A2B7 92]|uniref:Uncharacterized protein n=1 Tax=Clostridium botulinum TaxID=1491 RepID=A0A433Z6Z8_CLOBO|nr:hypothetical protein [Clostridium botulinum]NFI74507.1 hypothetical protein [Clostridium sporogenes]ACA57482.1 conserved domain protein [Clostridium botulinum A3 str. Loch Maree]KEI94155.1 hypothetical protein N494_18765 [Clostridium botulinum A2B7 92]MBD5563708.1 hypothetical protein [Clostridium botulinum]MBD5568436.1 hypothetical protein [Clostridium botulinum]